MAFTVTSFAYSGSWSYMLHDVGYHSEYITMNCQSAGGNMGAMNPGSVEIYFYASDGVAPYHKRVDYPNYGDFYWIHPIAGCQVTIQMSEYLLAGYPNGVNLQWID